MSTASIFQPPVPPTRLAEENEEFYEIIDGKKVEMPPMSVYAGVIASRLSGAINGYAKPRKLGEAVTEVLFQLPTLVGRNRRPDVAYVSADRWPRGRPIPPKDNAWEVVPDLGIEVVSPSDFAEELLEKIEEYFRAGVRLVWVVYPLRRAVHVYESLDRIRGLRENSELEGDDVLPGFRLSLSELFEP
jgi:Uma2 family endonuclease